MSVEFATVDRAATQPDARLGVDVFQGGDGVISYRVELLLRKPERTAGSNDEGCWRIGTLRHCALGEPDCLAMLNYSTIWTMWGCLIGLCPDLDDTPCRLAHK